MVGLYRYGFCLWEYFYRLTTDLRYRTNVSEKKQKRKKKSFGLSFLARHGTQRSAAALSSAGLPIIVPVGLVHYWKDMTEPGDGNRPAKAHSENTPNVTNSKPSPGYSTAPRHSSLNSDTTDTDDDSPKDNNGLVKNYAASAPGPKSTSAKTMAIESRVGADVTAPTISRHRGAEMPEDVASCSRAQRWEGTANTNTAAQERPRQEMEDGATVVTGYKEPSSVVVAGKGAGSNNSGHLAVTSTVGVGSGSPGVVSQQHLIGVGRPVGPNPQHHNDNQGAPTTSSGVAAESGAPPGGQQDGTATSSGIGVASVAVEGGRPGQGYSTPSPLAPSHEVASQSNNNIFPVPATPTRPTGQQQPQTPRAPVAQGEHTSLDVVSSSSSHLQAGSSVGSPATGGHSQLLPKFIRSGGSEDSSSDLLKTGTPRRRRLVRLDNGSVVVLPTNIYRQAAGVKLDLSLGGLRLNGERPTMKNRAFNFGVLPGINRENILALRSVLLVCLRVVCVVSVCGFRSAILTLGTVALLHLCNSRCALCGALEKI